MYRFLYLSNINYAQGYSDTQIEKYNGGGGDKAR